MHDSSCSIPAATGPFVSVGIFITHVHCGLTSPNVTLTILSGQAVCEQRAGGALRAASINAGCVFSDRANSSPVLAVGKLVVPVVRDWRRKLHHVNKRVSATCGGGLLD